MQNLVCVCGESVECEHAKHVVITATATQNKIKTIAKKSACIMRQREIQQ